MRVFCVVIAIWMTAGVAFADSELATVAQPPAAPGADEALYSCKQRQNDVEITFKSEMELKDLLTWVVGFTCKKFVLDPSVVMRGRKVVLVAPGKQTAAQAYDMFLTALSTMGLTVVPKGKLLMIAESATGRGQPLPFYDKTLPGDDEQMVRYLIRPQFAQADVVKTAVTPFKSDAGDIQVLGAFVLLTDHGSNVRDMANIAKIVDQPGSSDGAYAIPVMHADATKLEGKLEELMDIGAAGKGGVAAASTTPRDTTLTPTKLIVDERTNTLLVTGTEAAYQRTLALVERLDIALEIEGGTSMHVYQVGSAVADELAKTLNDAIQAQQQGNAKIGGGDAATVQGPVRIISDAPTNKLLVMSSGRDFLALRDVIRELDVPKRQVYIEAMILEVQLSDGLKLGTSSHGGYNLGNNSSLLVGGVQTPDLKTTSMDNLLSATGLIGGIVGKTLEGSSDILGKSIPSYAVLFNALADTSRTNILSTMPIIVVDNGEAKYKVGTNVPYKKGTLPTTSTSASQLTTNIEREPLLLELDIKPHISTDDSVLLDVKQSSKDMTDDTNTELGPTWTERGIDTRVLVRDQQTIVIGGLMQMRDTTSATKVPLLGDIPVLGNLFKYTSHTKKKINLLIMLTPYIIKDNLDLEMIRSRKQREYDEFVGSVSSLDGKPYQPHIDYRRKRGLVEEINRTVQEVEDDAAARAALHPSPTVTPGPIQTVPSGVTPPTN